MDDDLDDDAMFAEAEVLAEAFEADHDPESGWVASQLMEFKISYCDSDLTDWKPYELEEILLEVMPRKSSLDDADIDTVIPIAVAFLRWLGRTERLDSEMDGEQLACLVESWAGRFAEAMRDESRWGMAKRMFSGVDLGAMDLSDPSAMQRVVDEFNARSFGERDRIPGAPQPVILSLGHVPVGELLRTAPDLPAFHAVSELDNWLRQHDAHALVAGLPAAGESARGLVFRALLRHGEDANDAVQSLADVPALSAWVELWRVDAQLQEPTPVTTPDRLVEVLAVVLQMWGPSSAGRWARLLAAEPSALVAQAWRIRGAVTEEVLAALGGTTDDKALAKTARKALFKYRSVP